MSGERGRIPALTRGYLPRRLRAHKLAPNNPKAPGLSVKTGSLWHSRKQYRDASSVDAQCALLVELQASYSQTRYANSPTPQLAQPPNMAPTELAKEIEATYKKCMRAP